MMTVHEVSELTGLSIRTIQYYDRIGLLRPAEYTESGYRLYDTPELERLQQIMLFTEIHIVGFSHANQLVRCQLHGDPGVTERELICEMRCQIAKQAPAEQSIQAEGWTQLKVPILICRKCFIRSQYTDCREDKNKEQRGKACDVRQASFPPLFTQYSVLFSF